jgi:hypothetical protein
MLLPLFFRGFTNARIGGVGFTIVRLTRAIWPSFSLLLYVQHRGGEQRNNRTQT